MKHALHSVVFGLLLASAAAVADDMPTFKLLMKEGRFFPETLEVPAGPRVRLDLKTSGGSITVRGERDLAVDAQTSGGSIRADGGQGDFTLNTSGGSITVGSALRTVDASTSGGSISVGRVGPATRNAPSRGGS